MGDRLQVSFDLPADLSEVPIAPLLLQPLVENSIQHGLEPNVSGGRIALAARKAADTFVLTVRNTGRGLSAAQSDVANEGTYFGLQQVRVRLNALYGGTASFVLENATDSEGGTIATIRMPIKTS